MKLLNAGLGLRLCLCASLLVAGCDASDPATLDPAAESGNASILEVAPANATIPLVGQSVKLDVTVRTGRGRQVTNALVLWETSSPNIAMVNADGTVTGLDVGIAQIRARVGDLTGVAVVTVAAKPYAESAERLQIVPSGDTIAQVGGTTTLQATAYDVRNRSMSAPTVSWFSLDPMVATVQNGRITGHGKGAARILITNGRLADTAVVWVQPTSTVARVSVAADTDTLWVLGETARVSAAALDIDGKPIPGEVLTIAVLDPSVVSIDGDGNVVATGSGEARITANYGKTSDTTTLAVMSGSSSSSTTVTLSPKVDTIPKVGDTIKLTATVSGNAKLKWQSLDPYATVTDESGTVLGLRQGVARIVAKAGPAADTATVWIAPAAPTAKAASVVVQPTADTIDVVGGTVQLTSLVLDAQGSPVQDQTVSWSTPNSGLVTVSASGLVKGLAKGVAVVIATVPGTFVADSATIWVAPVPIATDIEIDPGSDTIPSVGSSITLDAEAVDANGQVLSTANAMWQSLDPTIAQVAATGTPASSMLITGKARGVARIVATQQSMVDTAFVTVEDVVTPQPASVRVTPGRDTINVGATVQLNGTVRDQNGQVIGGLSVAWQPLDPTIASVSGSGVVTGLTAGIARIRAYYGTLADTATIWVTPTSTPKPGTYAVPASIDASGTTDVTNALTAFIDNVPDNSTIVFPDGGKYRVEGMIRLLDRNNITIEGNNSLIFALTDGSGVPVPVGERENIWPRNRAHVLIHGGGGIIIRQLHVRGPNVAGGYTSTLEGQHGFDLAGVDGVELDRVRVETVWGDFVFFGPRLGTWGWARNIHVHDSHFDGNGRQGFGLTGSEDVIIERNQILRVRRTMFDFEPSSDEVGGNRRITIRDNITGEAQNHWVALHGLKGVQEDISILRNTVGMPLIVSSAIDGNRRKNIRIEDNVSTVVALGPQRLMQINRADGLIVRGNVQQVNRSNLIGVTVRESCQVTIGTNNFTGSYATVSEIISYDLCQ